MAIIKCKMCGGDMEISADKTFGTCEYCGSVMTLPKISDEQRAAAFNRGNHFRRAGEFDKALSVYERIVAEDDTDAEAHWCCALCRFGIEYVEDPATYEYMPTCHRASFDSFLEDVDYLAAVEHSDGITRRQYQKDAAKIAEVQRGILATSQNEEPFDVFICYKETDENGQRTKDSIMAQDIYYQLTEQGRRVFFARITLEDKGGAEYEPYIFAALNSAKVMIAVGTKPEHFNAVWVKNEWSRFLSLMKKDHSKLLLPCYRDMDPYDLPEALSVLQSYDMSKIGFIQDLIRGVNKVLDAAAPKAVVKETVVVSGGNANVAPLLKRVFMYLEDEDFDSADEYCERVLDIDPENAQAYLGKLMAELGVQTQNALRDEAEPFDHSNNYQKVLRFGGSALATDLKATVEYIKNRNENERLQGIYARAKEAMGTATTEEAYQKAAQIFETITEYMDASALATQCYEKAEIVKQKAILSQRGGVYSNARVKMDAATTEAAYKEAAQLFETIAGHLDASALAAQCYEKAEVARLEGIYSSAKSRMSSAKTEGEYKQAASQFEMIGDYLDSATLVSECYDKAEVARKDSILFNAKSKMTNTFIPNYERAIELFESISGWKDADEQIYNCKKKIEELKAKAEAEEQRLKIAIAEEVKRRKKIKMITIICAAIAVIVIVFLIILNSVIIPNGQYNDAVVLMEAGRYEDAISAFEALNGYKDSAEQTKICQTAIMDSKYMDAVALMEEGKYDEAIDAFAALKGYKDSNIQIEICETTILDGKYNEALELMTAKKYEKAIAAFTALNGYRDSKTQIKKCETESQYAKAQAMEAADNKAVAAIMFYKLGDYADAREKAFALWNEVAQRENISTNCHTVGIKTDGTVVAVGDNKYGECEVSDWRNIVSVSIGFDHTVGLKANGTVVAVGKNGHGQCNVSGWHDIVAVNAEEYCTVGLKADGTVVAVGQNSSGQCDVSDWQDIVAISAGSYHTVGLKADGTVVAVGKDRYGLCTGVSAWRNIVAISAEGDHTVGLKADGTVVAVGLNNNGQCEVSDWRDIVGVESGGLQTVGIKADGTVVAVGSNFYGQCDVADWTDIKLPNKR